MSDQQEQYAEQQRRIQAKIKDTHLRQLGETGELVGRIKAERKNAEPRILDLIRLCQTSRTAVNRLKSINEYTATHESQEEKAVVAAGLDCAIAQLDAGMSERPEKTEYTIADRLAVVGAILEYTAEVLQKRVAGQDS